MDLAGAAAALAAVAWAVTLLALAVLALYGAHRLHLAWAAWGSRRATPAPLPPLPADAAAWPVVTVQLPLFNEPAVAARLVDAAAALDWPAGRLEVQVLDDSTDGTSALVAARVAHWRARGADVVHLRRTDRAGYKAGALEAGRLSARGALLLVLDADFVPAPDLLVRTVPHFADPTVGMVQVRWDHLNRGPGLLTELEAVLLDGHFAVEQRARASRGAVFNFNGTAGHLAGRGHHQRRRLARRHPDRGSRSVVPGRAGRLALRPRRRRRRPGRAAGAYASLPHPAVPLGQGLDRGGA